MRGETIDTLSYQDFSRGLFDKSFDQQKPLRGQIELTYRCNLRCVHCYTDCFNNPKDISKEMATEKILKLIDETHEAGCLWLCLTGGEIFMHKDFFEIYDYAQGKGFILTLFTNVTMVTEAIADRLALNPPFCIETSCHGVDETFDRITQVPGSFKRFDKGIRLLLAKGLPVEVKTKAMSLNRNELKKIKEYVESLGFPFNFSTDIHPDLKGSGDPTRYRLSPEEIVHWKWYDFNRDAEVFCVLNKEEAIVPDPSQKLFRCGCGANSFLIGAHGKLASCVFNRLVEKDLREVPFEQAVATLFRETQSLTFQGFSPCRSCKITLLCEKKPGMLKGVADPEMPERHFCETAHLKAKKLELNVTPPQLS